jgi:hypothetical protein
MKLRGRRDLRASIGEDIDELLAASGGGSRPMGVRNRVLGLVVGAILGGVVGVLDVPRSGEGMIFGELFVPFWLVARVYFGIGGAIAGFVSGTHPRLVPLALLGALLSSIFAEALIGAPFVGAPIGAIVGASGSGR